MTILDAQARAQAINPKYSYLVQAPAGSGKTELLIQRILALLATVNEPEEVLALTFTRKAAAEMRERVLKALFTAQRSKPKEPHAQTTWNLAHAVLQRSEQLNWRLIDYPARLRVMTLDAFSSGLARQLPVLSGFGQTPTTADFAEPIYQQAMDDLLDYTQQKQAPKPLKEAINTLILHQDCQIEKLKSLLLPMLSRREQWLPDVLKYSPNMDEFRQHLQNSLSLIITHTLTEANQQFSSAQKSEIARLAHFSAPKISLNKGSDEHELTSFLDLSSFPSSNVEDVASWKAIAHLLMTSGAKADIRKSITKTQGFDTSDETKPYKQSMLALLNQLHGNQPLVEHLQHVRRLPDSAVFEDASWHMLEALFLVLKMLASQLWQSFEQHKQVDFIEIMLRAKQALGQSDGAGNLLPSDALLRLDHQIKHILIDEFQDTSTLQIDLLSRLTAGWDESEQTRTLFMVGDPMQSIYRFRKAEVSLFLQAADNDLPDEQYIPHVTSLKLSQNFRSSPHIVDWVNQAFSQILPMQNDVLSGAIAYTPSHPFKKDDGLVSLNILGEKCDHQEAQLIVGIIKQRTAKGKRVGVLARSRSHLKTLMQTLQDEHIAFRALDVLPLNQQPEIIDLLSLTSSLLHPADHIAWASLLRSPILGLKTQALFDIFNPQPLSAWQAIQQYSQSTTNTSDKLTLERFIAALEPALNAVRRIPLQKLVESTWLRLNTPVTLDKVQLNNADVYFNLLSQMDDGPQVDMPLLKQRLQKMYAKPEIKAHAEQVELLTMHSAKGLQWDTVILCGLGKTPRAKDKDVLVQTETNTHQGKQLLLSPLSQHGADQTYDLIRNFEKQRDALEIARLLYVACTRAETELHMFGEVRGKDELPASSSLLALLWQDNNQCFDAKVEIHPPIEPKSNDKEICSSPQKLPQGFIAPKPHTSIQSEQAKDELLKGATQPEFSWAGAQAKAVGIALHAALQHIAERGLSQWSHSCDEELKTLIINTLHHEGLSSAYLDKSLNRCEKGLEICFKSTRFRWILSEQHKDTHYEWPLTYVENGVAKHMVLDYSFIDQDGTRWIVDYKTGSHFDDVDSFLDQELKRYTEDTPQLPNYVKVLQALEPKKTIKAALYFPMLDGWRVLE
ncbi:MAG: UvrD-helicase domain-containing protein [Ghiorsea sp.]